MMPTFLLCKAPDAGVFAATLLAIFLGSIFIVSVTLFAVYFKRKNMRIAFGALTLFCIIVALIFYFDPELIFKLLG